MRVDPSGRVVWVAGLWWFCCTYPPREVGDKGLSWSCAVTWLPYDPGGDMGTGDLTQTYCTHFIWGETFERRGGVHMGFPQRLDTKRLHTILN